MSKPLNYKILAIWVLIAVVVGVGIGYKIGGGIGAVVGAVRVVGAAGLDVAGAQRIENDRGVHLPRDEDAPS